MSAFFTVGLVWGFCCCLLIYLGFFFFCGAVNRTRVLEHTKRVPLLILLSLPLQCWVTDAAVSMMSVLRVLTVLLTKVVRNPKEACVPSVAWLVAFHIPEGAAGGAGMWTGTILFTTLFLMCPFEHLW